MRPKSESNQIVGDNSPRRILVVFLSGLGNTLLFRPTLKAIQSVSPDAKLDFLIENSTVETLVKPDFPQSSFVYWPGGVAERVRVFLELKKEKYDCIITTFEAQGWKLALFGRFTAIPMRIGYAQGKWYDSLYTHLLTFDPDMHDVDRHLQLLKPLGICLAEPPDMSLNVCGDFAQFHKLLPDNKSSVCIHAGCSRNLIQKRWPLERFASVARELISQNYNVIFLGGQDEVEMIPELKRLFGDSLQILIGKLNIWETAFVIRESKLMISNDSGLMHLACAVSTPVVAVFGPTEISKNRPYSPDSKVVKADVKCRPCDIVNVECNLKCLGDIAPEDVLTAVCGVLSKTPANPRVWV